MIDGCDPTAWDMDMIWIKISMVWYDMVWCDMYIIWICLSMNLWFLKLLILFPDVYLPTVPKCPPCRYSTKQIESAEFNFRALIDHDPYAVWVVKEANSYSTFNSIFLLLDNQGWLLDAMKGFYNIDITFVSVILQMHTSYFAVCVEVTGYCVRYDLWLYVSCCKLKMISLFAVLLIIN